MFSVLVLRELCRSQLKLFAICTPLDILPFRKLDDTMIKIVVGDVDTHLK